MHDTIPNGARLASRIILIGPNQTVLYLSAHEPQSRKRIWVMPGGGLDGDETFEDAAKRELCEETGCAFTLGPCVWVRHHYVWNGKKRDQYERFFVAHTETLILNPKEQDGYVSGHKWWSLDELRSSSEEFAPRSVARLLPDSYAHDFAAAEFHGAGAAEPQQLDLYHQPQLLYRPLSQSNAWLEGPFTVTNQEPLRLLVNATKSYDFGRYQAYLNGVKLGDPFDLYSAKLANEELHLRDFWPEPGAYRLRLECVGKNAQSAGYYCGIESVRLRERRPRVAQYGYDRTNNWRNQQRLYR